MKVKFLGTNGWFPTPQGQTMCVAVFLPNRLVVFDAGTGFSQVREVCEKSGISKIDIFLSHLHLDHTQGLHMLPMLPKSATVRIFVHAFYLKKLQALLSHPYTASMGENKAKISLYPFEKAASKLTYKITSLPLVHADPCWGYRLELGAKSFAYCTDTGPCENIAKLAKSASLFVSECSLLPDAAVRASWPHMPPELAARAAKQAKARKLVLAHFDANQYPTLRLRKKAQDAARKIFKNTVAAHDGLEIDF